MLFRSLRITLIALGALLTLSTTSQVMVTDPPPVPEVTVAPKAKTESDTIVWSSPSRLTWHDYKGLVPSPPPAEAATAVSLLAQAEKSRDGKTVWYIHPGFSRSRSWVIPTPKDPGKLLAHERLHFDLVEVYSRLVRKYVVEDQAITPVPDMARINSKIEALRAELDSEGKRYDEETQHGADATAQERWAADIAKRLKELAEWRWGACGLKER